jgi:hypothetical protein
VRLTENPLFLPHPDRSKPMAQDSRNVDSNVERASGTTTASNPQPNRTPLQIDTSRVTPQDPQQPTVVAVPNGGDSNGANGPNGTNGGGVQNGQGQNGAQQNPNNLAQDSLSLMQLKRLVGENARNVVSLCGYFPSILDCI